MLGSASSDRLNSSPGAAEAKATLPRRSSIGDAHMGAVGPSCMSSSETSMGACGMGMVARAQ